MQLILFLICLTDACNVVSTQICSEKSQKYLCQVTQILFTTIKPGNSFCELKHEKNCKCCPVLLLLPSGQIEIIVINSVSKKQLSLTQFRITLTIGQLSLSSNFGLK